MSEPTHHSIPPQGPSTSLGDRAGATATTAKDEAGTVADTARSQVSDVAAASGEQVRAVVTDAKHQARRVLDESREQLRSQASEQTTKLAGSVRDVSQQLHGVAQGGAPQQGLVADLADQAAGVTSRLADELENRSPEELVDEARRFARRRPGMFLLGALGAGFVAGRLVRSIDTQSLVDAAKSGADVGDGGSTGVPQGGAPLAAASPVPGVSSPASRDFPQELSSAVRP